MPPTTSAAEGSKDGDYLNLRDSFVPLFSGQPQDYKEYRKRLMLYHHKMKISKRTAESVLNILGSFQGVVWRLFEDFSVEEAEKEDGFGKIISKLDKNFEYDDRVLLPNDFEEYFNLLQRKPQQSLLSFVTDHDTAYRRLTAHNVTLPGQVQGWHLLRRAALTKEQRQMVTLKAPTLEKTPVIEALYLLFGQDYKAGGWNAERDRKFNRWKGRGYAAFDDEDAYWTEQSWPEEAYYEADDWYDDIAPDDEADFDYDAIYYGEENEPGDHDSPEDPQELAEEYDHAYATYLDARQRFQQLKLARGYLPIVALTDGQNTSAASGSSSPSNGAGKNKGKGKNKSKGKGKNVVRYPSSSGGKSDPKGRAKATTCLRCGQPGHWAAQCPQSAKPPVSPNKRPAPTEGMALQNETALVLFQDEMGTDRPDATMLDPGASAFLCGYGPFGCYLSQLHSMNYPINTIRFARCDRQFHFGGDASSRASWTVDLPVMIDGQFGTIQCYLVPGNTPMLMGRPVIEALHMGIDFSQKRIRFGRSPWTSVLVGSHGEYLLSLTTGMEEVPDPTKALFSLRIAEETPGSHLHFEDFNKLEQVFQAEDLPRPGSDLQSTRLHRHALRTMETQLVTTSNSTEAYITQELHNPPDHRRVLWEIYCGKARTGHIAEELGMKVERFSLDNGWDFNLISHQQQLLQRLDEEEPDEVLVAPECRLWSRMQTLACRTPAQQEALKARREHHHRRHLGFAKRIYLRQVNNARHAHLEQPRHALSWNTTALRDLPGYYADFDQCRYGAMCMDTDGIWRPVQKSTRLLTTKQAVLEAFQLKCDHDHHHCPLEGSAPGYGRRTTYLEDYQPGFAATLAAALARPEAAQLWDTAYVVDETGKKETGHLLKLKSEHRQDALRTVQRLHRNLGHPAPDALADLLTARGAHPTVIAAAKEYKCVACLKHKKPNQVAPSSMPQPKTFNEVIQADVFYLKPADRKFAVLSIVDVGTKYMAAYLLHEETSKSYITALEKMWVRHFGPPKKLITDEGRPWLGAPFESCSLGIDHQVAPGEAHERLSLVERRHAVLRRACEVYMDDRKLNDAVGIKEALCYVVPQQNATPSVAGFSPSQWVIGFQPELSHLMDDNLNAAQLASNNSTFEENLERRTSAKMALASADADSKLRRALSRKYQGQNRVFQLGERVWFWRDARHGALYKIRWLGPAHVVLREEDAEADTAAPKVKTYWLAYKTQLIRAAPHHVRADILGPQHVLEDLQSALNKVRQLKSRGVTRFYDLRRVNRQQLDDVEEDEQHTEPDGPLHEDDDDEPPRHRFRLEPPVPTAEAPPQLIVPDDEYEPTSPAHSSFAPTSPRAPPAPVIAEPNMLIPLTPAEIAVPGSPATSRSRSRAPTVVEPSEEPTVPSAAATPHSASAPASTTTPTTRPTLDPATAALYETVDAESFQQRRARFNRQETLSFGPMRRQRIGSPQPYNTASHDTPATAETEQDKAEHDTPATAAAAEAPAQVSAAPAASDDPALYASQKAPDHALLNHAFQVSGIEANCLPKGWTYENGYFQLDKRDRDFWEVKAGCLIRHHVIPRRSKMCLHQLPKDSPFSSDQLDLVRVTIMYDNNGKSVQQTDDGYTVSNPLDRSWTGVTIFQIKGDLRREMAMFAKAPLQGARQLGKETKLRHAKSFKKDKNKNNLSERHMTPDERAAFKAAKVKELQSFFDNNVWQFETTKEAEPSRTLTSRMLLKWSKNPDGSPRAKARLIVRGFMDPDAWEGTVPTSSPTTTRLSRSMLLSLASTMQWPIWTSDIATAFLQGRPQTRKLWAQLPQECLQLLGATADTRMLLLKPCYGQIDAPRSWFMAAVDKLSDMGLRQHPQDPCCFLIYEGDLNPEYDTTAEHSNLLGPHGLCGMVIMHVDDMLGCGSPHSQCYHDTISKLKGTFNFREWKTGDDGKPLTYCGCDIQVKDDGFLLNQTSYMGKVKPITYDKKRSLTDALNQRELTQLRGLLGSLQWPAVQSSPHLQSSTSILSGHVTKATLQTVADTNRLLRFAKENADVGLQYSHLGEVSELCLVCFFDAAFATRSDGASQAGYVVLMVNKALLQANGPEGAYHVLDWRSLKTPRVARSSLGAEAQSGGQACDALEHASIYWSLLVDPRQRLKELLDAPSLLSPTMITDAKALYDSYHREGVGSSVVDKRVSLEIRVMKDRLTSLGGSLRWMSSERQLADGLTKESARALLAQRLRHGRLKLVWDPSYKAAKKKTKAELQQSLAESIHVPPPPMVNEEHMQPIDENLVENDVNVDEQVFWNEEIFRNSMVPENVMFARTDQKLEYVTHSPSHVGSRSLELYHGRKTNFMFWFLLLFMAPLMVKAESAIAEAEAEMGWFGTFVCTFFLLFVSTAFICGRWSHGASHRVQPQVAEAAVQKDEAIIPARLREEVKRLKQEVLCWSSKAEESRLAAVEATTAMDLVLRNQNAAETLAHEASQILKIALRQMDEHGNECPFYNGMIISRHGARWHTSLNCSSLAGRDESLQRRVDYCRLCSLKVLPPDLVDEDMGSSVRTLVFQWLDRFEELSLV